MPQANSKETLRDPNHKLSDMAAALVSKSVSITSTHTISSTSPTASVAHDQYPTDSALADPPQIPLSDDKQPQGTGGIRRAASGYTDMTPSKPPIDCALLLWKCTPFTLESIGDNLYCPRLNVEPNTALSRILPPESYPLDSAAILLLKIKNSGTSLPCEASRVLTVFDELQDLDFSETNISLLDPKLFTLSGHSHAEKVEFYKDLGGWIDLLGQSITVPGVCDGIWYIDSIQIDYVHLQMALCLSKGFYNLTFPLPLHWRRPSERKPPLQVSLS